MNAPHHTYGGNVIQLGRVIATARAEHERITARSYLGDLPRTGKTTTADNGVYAPTAESVESNKRQSERRHQYLRTDVDDLSTRVIWAMLAGCAVAMCLAVAILPTNF